MAEKQLDLELKYEYPWAPSDELYDLNVMGNLPVLVDINGNVVFGHSSIREYLEELYPERNLLGNDYSEKLETRKIADWFSFRFFEEVYQPIIFEKITKRFLQNIDKTPKTSTIRAALSKFSIHLDYLTWLIDRRNWLSGKNFSIADISAASFISVLDYLGFVPWNKYNSAKNWYARIKSRPSFRSILSDNLPQIPPSEEYSNLDF
jgi:glutathione S-transferase